MTVQTMLTTKDKAIRLISRVQCAHIAQIRERRENHRQEISVAGRLRPIDSPNEIDVLTRDLSSEGLGLITVDQIDIGTVAEVELSLTNCSETIFAKCTWCDQLGSFYISGWKFINSPNEDDSDGSIC